MTVKPQRLEISLIAKDEKIVEIVAIRRPNRNNEMGIFPKARTYDEPEHKYTNQGVTIANVFDVVSTSGLGLSDTTMKSFSGIYDELTNIAIRRGCKDDYRITTEIKPTDDSQ